MRRLAVNSGEFLDSEWRANRLNSVAIGRVASRSCDAEAATQTTFSMSLRRKYSYGRWLFKELAVMIRSNDRLGLLRNG